MQQEQAYIAQNKTQRERLQQLTERLSDEQLASPMPGGWTVAAVLAHMAMWDARALALMNNWAAGGVPSKADHEPEDIDWVNDMAKPLCLALPPRRAAELALELAQETDRRVEALPEATLSQLYAIGPPFNLSRAEHRREHLDEIEQAIQS